MDSKKKILILHASAGHGHEKAALAIAEALALEGVPSAVRDSLDLVPKRFGRFYKNSYLSMIKSSPFLWGFSYYSTDIRLLGPLVRLIRRFVNAWATRPMQQLLLTEKPDVLICTHFMAAEVAGAMKRAGTFSGKVIVVVTDFLAHAFWIDPAVDMYAAGSEITRGDLIRRGVQPEKVTVTGIPTASAFRGALDERIVRNKLNLPNGSPVVLLTSGGAGVGAIGDAARSLAEGPDGAHVLLVCGTNKELLAGLSDAARSLPRLHVFGFVDNMQELMRVSDLLMGKAGGLTLSESFCLGLPVIMMRPVPGQEERNAAMVQREGAGVVTQSVSQALEAARSIMGNPSRLAEMKTAAKKLGRPEAAGMVARMAFA